MSRLQGIAFFYAEGKNRKPPLDMPIDVIREF